MQYHVKPSNTVQYHAIQCNTMQYYSIQSNTMKLHAIPCIIINCWRSVPLPCGQYMAIFDSTMLIFFCKVNSKNIIVMVSCTEEVDHCKHNMIHHLNHAPGKGKIENHFITCERIVFSKIYQMNEKWCKKTKNYSLSNTVEGTTDSRENF